MKNLTLALAAVFIATLVIDALTLDVSVRRDGEHEPSGADQVVASFERELNRQPSPAGRPRREAVEDDVLYRAVNEIHWTEADAKRDETDDETDDETEESDSLDETTGEAEK